MLVTGYLANQFITRHWIKKETKSKEKDTNLTWACRRICVEEGWQKVSPSSTSAEPQVSTYMDVTESDTYILYT
jgi:hypothetical protein